MMRRMVLVCLVCLCGCGGDAQCGAREEACSVDDDCCWPNYCVEGTCRQSCQAGDDCEPRGTHAAVATYRCDAVSGGINVCLPCPPEGCEEPLPIDDCLGACDVTDICCYGVCYPATDFPGGVCP